MRRIVEKSSTTKKRIFGSGMKKLRYIFSIWVGAIA
jgi:hypothetical protein